MHMLYDDEKAAFSSIILHAGQRRNIQVFIPTLNAQADFSTCYSRFKRLSAAPEVICEQIQQSLDNAPDDAVYNTLCALKDSLKESRYRFGQECETYTAEKGEETQAWLEQFADTIEHLETLSPTEFKHHLYCHHLDLGEEPVAVFRLHGVEIDVFETDIQMAQIDHLMARMYLPSHEAPASRSQLH